VYDSAGCYAWSGCALLYEGYRAQAVIKLLSQSMDHDGGLLSVR
jgi:hypothetical protein